MRRFIDETITVQLAGEVRKPAAFTWRGTTYTVTQIEGEESDWGFSRAAARRNWRTRRHRNIFRVRTQEGRIFELYLERTGGRRAWYLLYELTPSRDEA